MASFPLAKCSSREEGWWYDKLFGQIWEPCYTVFSHPLNWRLSTALLSFFFLSSYTVLNAIKHSSPSKHKFPPTVMSNTLVISFNVFMRWCCFQIQRFREDYPSVPKKILVGLAIYSCFAQKTGGWLHHERKVKISPCVNKPVQEWNWMWPHHMNDLLN